MRKNYLDNLRVAMILLLFPVHTFMIWNNFGGKFYVWGGEHTLFSTLITIVNPWFMSVLFVIAGMCCRYSLTKRSTREFIKERFSKLLIPLISGMLFLVPLQTLYARKFFFSYKGSVIDNYQYFFTHFTDLSGYDGGFTPGHLWFILFLFLISILSLIIIKYVPYAAIKSKINNLNIAGLLLLCIPVWIFYYLGNFGGFSLGKYLTLYLIGYYVLSNDAVMEKLLQYKKWIVLLFLCAQALLTILYFMYSYYGDFLVNFTGWLGVLACLCLGKAYLNQDTPISRYLNTASFGIYILHQTILVFVGYYVLTSGIDNIVLQALTIGAVSFVLTMAAYEAIRHIPFIRTLFGIK